MKNIKKIAFVFILSIALISPHSNGVSAYTSGKEVYINKNFSGDNIRAKKEGEVCKKVTKEHGIKHTVKDTFIETSTDGEEHIREEIIELSLDEISDSTTVTEVVKNMFGIEVVYAGAISNEAKDIAITVKVKLTIKYVLSTYNGLEYVRITKAKGKLIGCGDGGKLDSGVSIASNKYTVGMNGFTKKDGWQQYSYSGTGKRSVGTEWVYKPSNWKAVASDSSAVVGAHQTVTLKRGGSTWKVKVESYYAR